MPYDTQELLRLRWVLAHLPAPADFKPQRCCWSACPIRLPFPNLAAFLVHFLACEHRNVPEYPCLYSLDCAWYDNRRAWQVESTLPLEEDAQIKPGLTWPSNGQAFSKRQSLPLDLYKNWTEREISSGKVDAVRYKVSISSVLD